MRTAAAVTAALLAGLFAGFLAGRRAGRSDPIPQGEIGYDFERACWVRKAEHDPSWVKP